MFKNCQICQSLDSLWNVSFVILISNLIYRIVYRQSVSVETANHRSKKDESISDRLTMSSSKLDYRFMIIGYNKFEWFAEAEARALAPEILCNSVFIGGKQEHRAVVNIFRSY